MIQARDGKDDSDHRPLSPGFGSPESPLFARPQELLTTPTRKSSSSYSSKRKLFSPGPILEDQVPVVIQKESHPSIPRKPALLLKPSDLSIIPSHLQAHSTPIVKQPKKQRIIKDSVCPATSSSSPRKEARVPQLSRSRSTRSISSRLVYLVSTFVDCINSFKGSTPSSASKVPPVSSHTRAKSKNVESTSTSTTPTNGADTAPFYARRSPRFSNNSG